VKSSLRLRPQDIDDNGALRVRLTLWVVLIFLNRHLLLLVLGAVSVYVGSRSGIDAAGFAGLLSGPWFMAACLPAFPVLCVALLRRPTAGSLPRLLWRSGLPLLLAAAATDAVLLAVRLYQRPQDFTLLHVSAAVLDVYVAMYLLRSRYVRALFRDFPPSPTVPS